MTSHKLNCWEHLKCGREPGGAKADEFGPCPAATDESCDGINHGKNAGRLCWAMPATLCTGHVEGGFAEKIERCRNCSFFRRIKCEEGFHFQLLEPGLGTSDPVALHRLLNNMVMLIGIKRDIFACLAVRPLLERITEHACKVTRSLSASVYLLDNAGKLLLLEAHRGSVNRPKQVRIEEDLPVGQAVRTRVFCKETTVLDNRSEPARVAVVPIGGHERLIGVLEALKFAGPFTADDEWFLRELALIASLGVENIRQIEDLRQLKEFDKAKSRFVALLMHHITSPLATIACSLQALSQLGENLGDKDREQLIEYSLERIGSIQGLSKKLLDLAAIRRGSSLTDVRAVRPAEPLRDEVDSQQARAREKGVKIQVTEQIDEACVLADPDGLRLIFGNLIANAIKYSTGTDAKVEVDLTADRDRVCVRIRDHGIGIPAEERERIFDEFHRASNVAEAGAPGFGIGLTVVKELVDRYGGHITLESEVGEGTAIFVELPMVQNSS